LDIVVLILHVVAAAGVIGLVLLQHGKGADVGAAFGSGASGSMFGASGAANFLSRSTAVLAAVFFATSLGLTFLGARKTDPKGVMEAVKPGDAKGGMAKPVVPASPVDQIPGAPVKPASDASSAPPAAAPAPGAGGSGKAGEAGK
jgi:preprotein translocase subunit SecG